MVVWDFHARKPLQTLAVPGAPLEIRWALEPAAASTPSRARRSPAKLWGVFRKDDGSFEAVELGRRSAIRRSPPLPVDISLSSDDRFLFVDSFMDGKVRVFDVSEPRAPKLVHEQKIGRQVNMVSQSLGREARLLHQLAARELGQERRRRRAVPARLRLGRQGARARAFAVDFRAEKLGRPHIMHFGQEAFFAGAPAQQVADRP